MLVIAKSKFETFNRRKYVPRRVNPEWVVYDTTTKTRVFGPSGHEACLKYLDRQ